MYIVFILGTRSETLKVGGAIMLKSISKNEIIKVYKN